MLPVAAPALPLPTRTLRRGKDLHGTPNLQKHRKYGGPKPGPHQSLIFPYYNMCLLLLFLPPFFSSYIHHNDNQKDSNVLLHEDTEVDEKQEEVVEEEKMLLLKKNSNAKRKNTRRKRSKTPLRAAVNTPSAEDKKSPLLSVSKTKSNKRSKTPQRNILLREDTSKEKPRVQEETNPKYQHPVVDGITKKKKSETKKYILLHCTSIHLCIYFCICCV